MTNEIAPEKLTLHVFSNHKDPDHLNVLKGVLRMVYSSAATGKLAVMQSLNEETQEEELVIVGVEQSESGVNCYPLFAPIKAEDVTKYSAPDGNGGWIKHGETS